MEPSIGARISRARTDRGLTQAALAQRLGVRQQTVAAWESGDNTPPTERLADLAAALDVSVDHLVRGVSRVGDEEHTDRLREALERAHEAILQAKRLL